MDRWLAAKSEHGPLAPETRGWPRIATLQFSWQISQKFFADRWTE
jgi:hypothetical protein